MSLCGNKKPALTSCVTLR